MIPFFFLVQLQGQLHIGVSGEVSSNQALFSSDGVVAGDGKKRSDRLAGFSISPFIGLPISKNDFIYIESSYVQKGYRFKLHNYFDQKSAISKNRFHYLSLNPIYSHNLNLKKRSKRKPYQGLYTLSGLFLGYKLHSKWKPAGGLIEEADPSFNSIDFGFIFGTRYIKHQSKWRACYVDIRYYHGLKNVADNPRTEAYHRSLALGIGYLFVTRKKR
ncbi:MAG: hypothetical protein ACI8YQ_003378 [Polaribacter sp.]